MAYQQQLLADLLRPDFLKKTSVANQLQARPTYNQVAAGFQPQPSNTTYNQAVAGFQPQQFPPMYNQAIQGLPPQQSLTELILNNLNQRQAQAQPPQPAQSLLSPFQQRRQDRQTRRVDRRQTRQANRGMLQQPGAVQQQAQQQPQAQTAPGASKANKAAIIMGALSNIFAGRDPVQGTAVMQQQMMAMQDREIQLAEIESKKVQWQALIDDPNTTADDKRLLESLGWQNLDNFLMTKYELGHTPTTASDYNRLAVFDTGGTQVGTVLKNDLQAIASEQAKGHIIGNLSTPTSVPKGSIEVVFEEIKGTQKATHKLITVTQGLADKFFAEPNSALAIGGTTQFIDAIIQNVDAAGNILGGKSDNDIYKNYVIKGTTPDGLDFSDRIQKASIDYGIAESRIKDLAYLFAAARGQEGRGLSDKDYENALNIVSGGVGARGRIAVLQDVANRLRSEAAADLQYEIGVAGPDLLTRLRTLPELPVFQDPYLRQTTSTAVDDVLKKYLQP